MNNITVAGQLGRDAETRYLPNGDPVASFSVADSQGKDKLTIWWNCSLFGKRAESLAPYLIKGQSVTVSGNVTEREYTDKDGNKRKSMDIRVSDVALQGGKREAAPATAPAAPRKTAAQSAGFDDDGSEIPF
jgi:single-strand DNA-binding protein